MWNLSFTPPTVIPARVLTRLPDAQRQPRKTEWVNANKPGHVLDSFLEGPCFDAEGNLYVTDIPYGRIYRITPALQWQLVVQYDGWPNGLALHPSDGSLWIADYRRGILRLNPHSGTIDTALGHRSSESFKGVNDLLFGPDGCLYFTDQGQTGLHDPSGRVYRFAPDSGRLDRLLDNVPSPNGLAVSADGKLLFVAATRANQVWRGPLQADGGVSKMGAFQTFFGASGPDGLALDDAGNLIVAHASSGAAFVLNPRGEVTHAITAPVGITVTNVALRADMKEVVLTESSTGAVLVAPTSWRG